MWSHPLQFIAAVVFCQNSGKPSSPYCDCSTIYWSVPAGQSNIFSWYPSWKHVYAIALSLRLGAPLCTPHDCVCGTAVDSNDVAYTVWAAGSQPVAVPDTRLSIISAEIPSSLELWELARNDGKRPDGVTSSHRCQGMTEEWSLSYMGRRLSRHSQQVISQKL